MRRHLAAAAALAAAPLTLAGTAAGAVFGPPQPLTTSHWSGEQATAQFDDGSALTVAQAASGLLSEPIQIVQRRPGAAAGAPVTVTPRSSGSQLIGDDLAGGASGLGSNRAGDAVIAWTDTRGVMTVTRRRDGSLGRPTVLARGDEPVAAMTPRGDAIVVFRANNGAVRAAVRPHGAARFRPPRTLTAPPAPDYEPRLALTLRADADGFVALWTSCTAVHPETERFPSRCTRNQPSAARIGADGRSVFVRTFAVERWHPWNSSLQLLSGPSGDALALLTFTRGSRGVVRVAHAPAGRGFGAARAISRSARTAIRATAASGAGGGFIAWIERTSPTSLHVVGADVDRRLNVGRPVVLSAASATVTLPRVRVGSDGSAAVFWPTARGAQPPIAWQLRARRRHGPFAPPVTLAAVERLAVAVAPAGELLALTVVARDAGPEPTPSCRRRFELRAATWSAEAAPAFHAIDSPCDGLGAPTLRLGADGTALAAWAASDGPESGSVRAAVRRPGGGFGAVRTAATALPLDVVTARLAGRGGTILWSAFRDGEPMLFASFADDLFADG